MSKDIMVVDDEQGIRATVKYGLENLNPEYNVITVENGEQCLEALRENKIPDLILLDIMMPGMSGWQVINRLRENTEWKKIPVIFLTAKTDDFSKTFGQTVSYDYVEKPFEIRDLNKRIEDVLRKASGKPQII